MNAERLNFNLLSTFFLFLEIFFLAPTTFERCRLYSGCKYAIINFEKSFCLMDDAR